MTVSSHMLAVVHTRARTRWFPRPRAPVRRRRALARCTARLRATRLVVANTGGLGPGSGIPWPSIGFSALSPGRARWVGRGLCDHRGGKSLIDALVAPFFLRLHTLLCTARVRTHTHALNTSCAGGGAALPSRWRYVCPDMRACGAEFPWDKDEPLSTSGIRTWMYKAPRQQLRQTTGPAQAHDSPAHTSSTQPSRTPPKTPRLAARRGPEVQARHPGHADTGGVNPRRRRADGGLGRRRRGRHGHHHKWLAWAHSWGFPSQHPSPPPATQSPQYVLDSAAL